MKQTFNIIICGIGGQGLITLLRVMSESALLSGFDVKTSELHGLSQRGGSVSVNLRFGEEVYSPVISKREADLIICLESQESLKAIEYSKKEAVFLINKYQSPTLSLSVSEKEVKNTLERIGRKFTFIEASDICQKELQNSVLAGTYLLGYALHKGFIPLKRDIVEKAMKKLMKEKYVSSSIKVLDLAEQYGK